MESCREQQWTAAAKATSYNRWRCEVVGVRNLSSSTAPNGDLWCRCAQVRITKLCVGMLVASAAATTVFKGGGCGVFVHFLLRNAVNFFLKISSFFFHAVDEPLLSEQIACACLVSFKSCYASSTRIGFYQPQVLHHSARHRRRLIGQRILRACRSVATG